LLPALLFPAIGHCAPQPGLFSASEEDVKAAVLYHLTQFVDWPDENNGDVYRICVAGDTATSTALQHLTQGKLVRSHPIRIERISGPMEARGCHVLFITACAKPRLAQYLMSVRDSGILTVGEQPGFLELGGMIELIFQGQHVGLTLSSETIQRSHLIVSSKLLRLDRRVGEKIPLGNH
jgi:YfiR/HmsC-like